MSAFGPKQTSEKTHRMSAVGLNSDMKGQFAVYSALGKSGQHTPHWSFRSRAEFNGQASLKGSMGGGTGLVVATRTPSWLDSAASGGPGCSPLTASSCGQPDAAGRFPAGFFSHSSNSTIARVGDNAASRWLAMSRPHKVSKNFDIDMNGHKSEGSDNYASGTNISSHRKRGVFMLGGILPRHTSP